MPSRWTNNKKYNGPVLPDRKRIRRPGRRPGSLHYTDKPDTAATNSTNERRGK